MNLKIGSGSQTLRVHPRRNVFDDVADGRFFDRRRGLGGRRANEGPPLADLRRSRRFPKDVRKRRFRDFRKVFGGENIRFRSVGHESDGTKGENAKPIFILFFIQHCCYVKTGSQIFKHYY